MPPGPKPGPPEERQTERAGARMQQSRLGVALRPADPRGRPTRATRRGPAPTARPAEAWLADRVRSPSQRQPSVPRGPAVAGRPRGWEQAPWQRQAWRRMPAACRPPAPEDQWTRRAREGRAPTPLRLARCRSRRCRRNHHGGMNRARSC
jgi:hypothetical protein